MNRGGRKRDGPKNGVPAGSILEKIEHSHSQLRAYIENRDDINQNVKRNLKEIECLTEKIQSAEADLERLVQVVVANDVRDDARRELALIRNDAAAIEECEERTAKKKKKR